MLTMEKAHVNGRHNPVFAEASDKTLGDFAVCVAKARASGK